MTKRTFRVNWSRIFLWRLAQNIFTAKLPQLFSSDARKRNDKIEDKGNPWDDRLSKHPDMGQRIVHVLQRMEKVPKKVVDVGDLSADEVKSLVKNTSMTFNTIKCFFRLKVLLRVWLTFKPRLNFFQRISIQNRTSIIANVKCFSSVSVNKGSLLCP